MSEAQKIATELGDLPIDGQWVQAEINRLNRRSVLPLAHVRELHEYLKYRAVKGTVSDFRSRAMDVLKGASQSCDWYSCMCNRRHTQSE